MVYYYHHHLVSLEPQNIKRIKSFQLLSNKVALRSLNWNGLTLGHQNDRPPRTHTHRELMRPISVLHVEKIPPFTLTFTLKRPLFLIKTLIFKAPKVPPFSRNR